jgi:hypothetical protein
MGLSLFNIISKSNVRLFKPKLLGNYTGAYKELRYTRLMSNYLLKTPKEKSSKVNNLFFFK